MDFFSDFNDNAVGLISFHHGFVWFGAFPPFSLHFLISLLRYTIFWTVCMPDRSALTIPLGGSNSLFLHVFHFGGIRDLDYHEALFIPKTRSRRRAKYINLPSKSSLFRAISQFRDWMQYNNGSNSAPSPSL